MTFHSISESYLCRSKHCPTRALSPPPTSPKFAFSAEKSSCFGIYFFICLHMYNCIRRYQQHHLSILESTGPIVFNSCISGQRTHIQRHVIPSNTSPIPYFKADYKPILTLSSSPRHSTDLVHGHNPLGRGRKSICYQSANLVQLFLGSTKNLSPQ